MSDFSKWLKDHRDAILATSVVVSNFGAIGKVASAVITAAVAAFATATP
jgi:hypothetical protein